MPYASRKRSAASSIIMSSSAERVMFSTRKEEYGQGKKTYCYSSLTPFRTCNDLLSSKHASQIESSQSVSLSSPTYTPIPLCVPLRPSALAASAVPAEHHPRDPSARSMFPKVRLDADERKKCCLLNDGVCVRGEASVEKVQGEQSTYVESLSRTPPGLEPNTASPPTNPRADGRAETLPAGRVGVAKFEVPRPLGIAGKRSVDPGRGVGLLGPARERAGVVRLFNLNRKSISRCLR